MTPTWEVRQGHVMDLLRAMPSESVHTIITSPPYWGLRDYRLPPQVWGGDPKCAHRWVEEQHRFRTTDEPYTDKSAITGESHEHAPYGSITCGTCGTCGAWRGSLGLEPTPELFVRHLVEVLVEALRVLRADGTLWLNLGDSYSRAGGDGARGATSALAGRKHAAAQRRASCLSSAPKNLLGIPWRVALAFQAAGATLRTDIIWSKPNCMPEAVTDRPTRAHEYLFLFSKGERYFYDDQAIREARTSDEDARGFRGGAYVQGGAYENAGAGGKRAVTGNNRVEQTTRNRRTVWTIATAPFPEAHFATFPPELVRPCIRAGTSERGCCYTCGAPVRTGDSRGGRRAVASARAATGRPQGATGAMATGKAIHATAGWKDGCRCGASKVSCSVLDPFNGAGTSGVVALEEGRSYVGLELNPDYVAMSERRLSAVAPLLARRAAPEVMHGS